VPTTRGAQLKQQQISPLRCEMTNKGEATAAASPLGGRFGCEFRNGIVPEWERLLFWAWLCILWSLRVGVVLYWELLILRNAGSVTLLLMNGYLAKEFQFGT
jgi:hypothetical protein